MVLGLVTGSMPMIVSLLFMQGITLTMWRSFLDKAIPSYNSEKWRKNLNQFIHGANGGSTTTSEQLPMYNNPTISSIPPSKSKFDQPHINSVTDSLQILANLDPKIIQLLSELQQSGQTNNNLPSPEQLNTLNSLAKLLQSSMLTANSGGIQKFTESSVGQQDMLKNIPQGPYIQHYTQTNPNDPTIQYYQVSYPVDSDSYEENAHQIFDYDKQQQQSSSAGTTDEESENNDLDNDKYEYIQAMNDMRQAKKKEQQKLLESNNLYEEVDYDDDLNKQDEEEAGDEELDNGEGDNENKPKMTIREKMRPAKIFAATKTRIRILKPKSKIFGKPRITKRMINFDKNSFHYAQSRLKEKFRNSLKYFPFLRQNSITKQKLKQEKKTVRQKSYAPLWRRTSDPSRGNFRFATPKVPILTSTEDESIANNNYNSNEISSSSKIETKLTNNKSVKQTKKVAQTQKKNLKLKSNKITLVDIDEVKDNCIIINKATKSKKQFNEVWSQKNGWNRCHPKSPNFRVSKGIVIPTSNIESPNDLLTTTMVPDITDESPTIEHDSTFEHIQESTPSETQISTTTLPTTIPIPDSFLVNFNNFLMNFVTTTMPSAITLALPTTTTTMIPFTSTRNYMNEFPKEFLLHILNAINSSKIDNFQINPTNDLMNLNHHKFPKKDDEKEHNFDSFLEFSNQGNINNNINKLKIDENDDDDGDDGDEDEDEDEDENEKNQIEDHLNEHTDDHEWNHQIKDDNRVDGKILVSHRFKRICYFLLNGGKDGQLDIGQLELHICSHLIVGYARISTNGMVVAQKPMEDTERYRRSTLMKLQYPKLKVLLSIGDLGGVMFSIVASTNHTRERFIMSILDICDEFNFDGIDIDWEFPGFRTPGSIQDKQNLVLLLKEIRLKSNKFWTNKSKIRSQFLISLAVGAPLMIASTSYIIPEIGKFVDFVNLMSYDFHYYRPDKPYTGHHAPLYPRSTDDAYFSTLNVAWTATYWANSGMPLRKIIVGVPTYARTYNLVVPINQNMINVPASGPGIGKGKLNYTQVCEFLRLPGTMKEYDFYSQVPYAYRGFDWIAYENEMSVATKAQWVVKTGMGGIVTFALNFDDTKGTCVENGKRFPLQKTISNILELASVKTYKKSLYVMNIKG